MAGSPRLICVLACSVHLEGYQTLDGAAAMDGGLTEIMLGVTLGAFSPLVAIAAFEKLVRTRLKSED